VRLGTRSTGRLGRRAVFRLASTCLLLGGVAGGWRFAWAQPPLFLGVTTSTENSGLLSHLLTDFAADHGVEVRAVTAGSGAVLNLARRGDVDLVLVHSPDDEERLLRNGYGIDRRPVMRNRYVMIGPEDDPAGVQAAPAASDAFAAIAASETLFLSRGDESGTHKAERRLWRLAGIDPIGDMSRRERPGWYRESGSGQGATLNIASNIRAYTLTDEATWRTFRSPGDLRLLLGGDEPALRNLYSVIRVNPDRHRELNAKGAIILSDWLTSKAGQASIASFQHEGRSLFQPAAELAG